MKVLDWRRRNTNNRASCNAACFHAREAIRGINIDIHLVARPDLCEAAGELEKLSFG